MKTNILWVSGHSILRHDIFALNCRQKKGKKGRHIVPRITVVFPEEIYNLPRSCCITFWGWWKFHQNSNN